MAICYTCMYIIDEYDIINLSNKRGAYYMKLMNTLSNETILTSYKQQGFDRLQLEFLEKRLNEGVNVARFAHKEYSVNQMKLLNEALKKDIDITLANNIEFTIDQMRHIISGLEMGLDVSIYALPKYRATQMSVIKQALKDGLELEFFLRDDVTFADLWYEYAQMSNKKRREAKVA